jgi:chaperone required for assembly of F1-ATPase
MSVQSIRRFYTQAEAGPAPGGFTVLLDGRGLKTPAKAAFVVPTAALAQACAAEWAAQGETLAPHAMPLTRLCNVAIDRTPSARDELAVGIGQYVETDLVCHRADGPERLVRRQADAWDPIVDWARAELGAAFTVVTGVIAAPADEAGVRSAAGKALALDDFNLTGLAHSVGLMGSAALAFALLAGRLEADGAFAAAALDDLYQIEVWGEDEHARARLADLSVEIEALARYFTASEGIILQA